MQFRLITAVLASVAVSGVVAGPVFARDEQVQQDVQAPQEAQADDPPAGLPGLDDNLATGKSSPAKPAADTPSSGGGGGFFGGLIPDTINVNYTPPKDGGGNYCSNNPYAPGCGGGGNYCYNNPYAPGCGGGSNYCFYNPYAPGCGNNFPPPPRRTPPGCPVYQESCNFCNFGLGYRGNSFIGEDPYVCPNQYAGYGSQYIGCSCHF
ncbi:hypothetical protein Slin15195_G072410 [Septoria linicola]|uniref:Uncharacterized protein n=1 Tax=Septoria linicola TaxID=215465 RepID=A0A9Q9AXV8_9PEZI|nr:hypothetical protein Slin15195_G072410 [Septoria linicola]